MVAQYQENWGCLLCERFAWTASSQTHAVSTESDSLCTRKTDSSFLGTFTLLSVDPSPFCFVFLILVKYAYPNAGSLGAPCNGVACIALCRNSAICASASSEWEIVAMLTLSAKQQRKSRSACLSSETWSKMYVWINAYSVYMDIKWYQPRRT